MPLFSQSEILRAISVLKYAARELRRHNWVQCPEVAPDWMTASPVCFYSALQSGAGSYVVPSEVIFYVRKALAYRNFHGTIVQFNDSPTTKLSHILDVLAEAISLASADSEWIVRSSRVLPELSK